MEGLKKEDLKGLREGGFARSKGRRIWMVKIKEDLEEGLGQILGDLLSLLNTILPLDQRS